MTAAMLPRDEVTVACLDLMGWFTRAGAINTEFAYMNESPLPEERKWWARVQIDGGTFVVAENHLGPVEAMADCKAQIIDLAGFDAGAVE